MQKFNYHTHILVWNELIELATEVLGKEVIEKLHFIENN